MRIVVVGIVIRGLTLHQIGEAGAEDIFIAFNYV